MYMIIELKKSNWRRIIEINDKAIYNYFKLRLCNFMCYIVETINSWEKRDCLIQLKDGIVLLTDENGRIYTGLNMTSCYALVCIKYINMKKERNNLEGWGIHAGGFIYNSNLYMLVGATHSGKSTAMFNLINNDSAIKYISDDIILFDKHSMEIIPFCKPLQMRVSIHAVNWNGCYIDKYSGENAIISIISPKNLRYDDRIRYNKIRMFLLVRDAEKALAVSSIENKQKYISLMTNCYNDCVRENWENIMKISDTVSGYQILFPDGVDVAGVIRCLL